METLRERRTRGPIGAARALELAKAAADGPFRGEVDVRDDGSLEFAAPEGLVTVRGGRVLGKDGPRRSSSAGRA